MERKLKIFVIKKITNITYGFGKQCDWRIIDVNRLKNTIVTIKNKNNQYNLNVN